LAVHEDRYFFHVTGETSEQRTGCFSVSGRGSPCRNPPDCRIFRGQVWEKKGGRIPDKFRPGMGQPSQPPEDASLEDFMFNEVPVFPDIRNENAVILVSQRSVPGHDFPHGLGRSPADPAGFVIQIPHQAAHDHTGRLRVRFGKTRNHRAHCCHSPPFYHLLCAVEERKKGIDHLSRRKLANFVKLLFKILLAEKLDNLFFQFSDFHCRYLKGYDLKAFITIAGHARMPGHLIQKSQPLRLSRFHRFHFV